METYFELAFQKMKFFLPAIKNDIIFKI